MKRILCVLFLVSNIGHGSSPILSRNDPPDLLAAYPIPKRDIGGCLSREIQRSDGSNRFQRQFCQVTTLPALYQLRPSMGPMFFPSRAGFRMEERRTSFAFRLPPFAYLIGDIVGLSSEEQMIRIATGRVVALMTYQIYSWVLTGGQVVCDPMGKDTKKSSVSTRVYPPLPYPAGIHIFHSLHLCAKQGNLLSAECGHRLGGIRHAA